MIRSFSRLTFCCFFCLCLTGCLEEETTAPVAQTKAVPKPASKPAPVPEQQMAEPPEVEFQYVTEGRRDPFVPLSEIRVPLAKAEPAEPATPLQSYDVVQFRLVGVIVGKGAPKAMVIAPDGKSYVIAKGVKIGKNNGVIIDITSEAVSVEEKYYDFSGNVIENIQEIAVPKREGV